MNKNKLKLWLLVVLSATILLTTGWLAFLDVSKQGFGWSSLSSLFFVMLIVAFMIFFFVRRYRDIKSGLPMEDERSRKVTNQAAAKAFYISLYWLLAISFFESFFAKLLFHTERLDASRTVGGGIAGMAISFLICWLYYNRRGKLL